MLAALVALGTVVFLIGQERQMFAGKASYKAVFSNVEGLKRGSSVRMGGIDIGAVQDISYAEDPGDLKLYVRLELVKNQARRIRADSVATIAGKGLLGDKLINISAGSASQPHIPAGGTIPTGESRDIAEAVGQLGEITRKAENVLSNLEQSTASLADEELHANLKSGVASLTQILDALARGDGYMGRLINDPEEAGRISRVVSNLERSSGEMGELLARVDGVVSQVAEGPGFAHDVVYGSGPTQVLDRFGRAADELALTLQGVREGDGLAHGLLYGDAESQRLAADLEAISGDVRQIVSDVRAGKGTLGALLADPSVYEDLKLLLGNVGRNRALRALVRYSIEQDEANPKAPKNASPKPE